MKNRIDNFIYNIPTSNNGRDTVSCESNNEPSISEKFSKKICEIVCGALNISWQDKRIFTSLLSNLIAGALNSNDDRVPGLIQQLVAKELEEAGKAFKHDLNIPESVKVRHNYTTHAKFNDIVRHIQTNFVRIEDIKTDGTFEKIWDQPCKCEEKDDYCGMEACSEPGPEPQCEDNAPSFFTAVRP